jgi:AraC family transcriptional regulator
MMMPKLAPGVFHGSRRLAGRIAGLTLTEYEFASGCAIPGHCHELSYFSLVLEGGWREVYGTKERERKPLTLTVHPAGERHSEWLGKDGARAFHVEFPVDWLGRLESYAAVLATAAQVETGPPTWHALRLYAEFRSGDPHFPIVAEGIVLESIGALARSVTDSVHERRPPWLQRARDVLHDRFAEHLTLHEIAGTVGVHPVHLARTFRRQFGCSVGEYLRRLRLQFVCRELTASDRPLAELALAAGFVDQSHLSRTVRRHTGMTPLAFRRAGRRR